MTALVVAPRAGREFVLDPRRTALDPRDEVFGRRTDPIGVDRPPTPHAARAVALEHLSESLPSRSHGRPGHGRDDTADRLASVPDVTILVDAAIWPHDGRRWAHMVSDVSHDELHEFAERLGIPRRGFQGDHYDVPTEWRERAIEMGAVAVSSRELLQRLRAAGLRRSRRTP